MRCSVGAKGLPETTGDFAVSRSGDIRFRAVNAYPPTPEELATFEADKSPGAYEKVVNRLLASPHYGERWARHWLDLVRYAETAGHEFDYDILGAWRYRDYVIRAFNNDVPYDQFVIEQVAGDLLDPPRRHPTEGLNESILGTGFYFLGEGVHSPVDLQDEEARRVDNQIDVFSKTFLGLTVACARCHDHKFDPISTRDYYALAGYLRSSRHQQAFIDPPQRIGAKVAALEAIKAEVTARLNQRRKASNLTPVAPTAAGVRAPASGRATLGARERTLSHPDPPADDSSVLFEDFDQDIYAGWSVTGDAFGTRPTCPGDWRWNEDQIEFVAPGQAHSGLVSDRLQGVLRLRSFTIPRKFIHYRAQGANGRINLVIDGFEKIRDPIYGGLTIAIDHPDGPRWYSQNVAMWVGHRAYIEIADGAAVDFTGGRSTYLAGDGFIAVDEIWFSDNASPFSRPAQLCAGEPIPLQDPALMALAARYHETEMTIPPPTLAPAIADGTGDDERIHIRGNAKTLGEIVPRRFLEVIDGPHQPPPESGSGRLDLARRMVRPSNPLLARVLVNRLWQHHFGEGLAASPDDFGVMGRPPSHPELLDWLASRFIESGWSIKSLHRLMVLSRAYRMQSMPRGDAERIDPENRLWHRMNLRRLEAEAIRDAMLAVSGQLNRTLYGPSIAPHLTLFMEGRGRPTTSGPLDGDGRRSLYLSVRRNFLNTILLAFDFPPPATTMGKRNVSNVPAQALTLLNDPFVIEQAQRWADRIMAKGVADRAADLDALYRLAFSRPPTNRECAEALAFLDDRSRASNERQAWSDLCHVLFNVKEFLFIP
jgi:hypothetical protein